MELKRWDIFVLIGEEGVQQAKGCYVNLKVIDKYVGEIDILESKHVLRIDQAEIEIVIPQTRGCVIIVNGAYRGSTARLLGVDGSFLR